MSIRTKFLGLGVTAAITLGLAVNPLTPRPEASEQKAQKAYLSSLGQALSPNIAFCSSGKEWSSSSLVTSPTINRVASQSMLKGQGRIDVNKNRLGVLIGTRNGAAISLKQKIEAFDKLESGLNEGGAKSGGSVENLNAAAEEIKKAHEELKKCCDEVESHIDDKQVGNRKALAKEIADWTKGKTYLLSVNSTAYTEKATMYELFSNLEQLHVDTEKENKEWDDSNKKGLSSVDLESKLAAFDAKVQDTRKKHDEIKRTIESKAVFDDEDLRESQLAQLIDVDERLTAIEDKILLARLGFAKNKVQSSWKEISALAETNPAEHLRLVKEDDAYNYRREWAQLFRGYKTPFVPGIIEIWPPKTNSIQEFRNKKAQLQGLLAEIKSFKSQSKELRNNLTIVENDLVRMESLLKVPPTGWSKTSVEVMNSPILGYSIAGGCAIIAVAILKG